MPQRTFSRLKTACRWAAVACLVALALIFVYVGQLLGRSLPTLIVTSLSSAWLLCLASLTAFYGRLSRRARRGTSLALACTLVLLVLGWGNLYRIENHLKYRDWLAYESKHFVFHCAPGSSLRDDMESYASVRDTAFEQICGALKVDFPGKIDFYVYDFLGVGWAVPEERQVFADKGQTIGHEMTHVISYYIARRPQKIVLLNEGLATYFNQKPVDHHQVAWKHMQENTLPPLTALADRKAFRRSNPYYQAASFVGYLIETRGMDQFLRFWQETTRYAESSAMLEDFSVSSHLDLEDSGDHLTASVQRVYGESLHELDSEWRAWLQGRYAAQ